MDRRSQESNETLMLEVQVQEADEAIKLFVYGELVANFNLFQFFSIYYVLKYALQAWKQKLYLLLKVSYNVQIVKFR